MGEPLVFASTVLNAGDGAATTARLETSFEGLVQ
jgi:hypothetical protein